MAATAKSVNEGHIHIGSHKAWQASFWASKCYAPCICCTLCGVRESELYDECSVGAGCIWIASSLCCANGDTAG
jgi:hypothetical protein